MKSLSQIEKQPHSEAFDRYHQRLVDEANVPAGGLSNHPIHDWPLTEAERVELQTLQAMNTAPQGGKVGSDYKG